MSVYILLMMSSVLTIRHSDIYMCTGPVQYLENCTVPEPSTASPNSNPAHTTDFDLAREEGICHAMCANEVSVVLSATCMNTMYLIQYRTHMLLLLKVSNLAVVTSLS